LNVAAFSIVGACHKEFKEPNQDAFSILVGDEPSPFVILGVFDGHGPNGGEVANLVKEFLTNMILTEMEHNQCSAKDALERSFKLTEEKLENSDLAATSGTTASVVVVDKSRGEIVIGYIGDCDVVLGKMKAEGGMDPDKVTISHRVDVQEERARVIESGATIDGSYIVHPRDENCVIQVSRSFGDFDMRGCGIISTPHIVTKRIEDYFVVVLGTDGLWDAVPISRIRSTFGNGGRERRANLFSQELLKSIRYNQDDTTAVVLYL